MRLPYILLTLTALIWAGNAIAGRYADGHVSPMVLTLLRWAIAVAVLGVIGRKAIRADLGLARRHWIYLGLMGAIGYTTFNFLLYTALRYTSAINVAIEQSAMPLFIFILTFAIFRKAAGALQIVGFLLTAVGVAVVATGGGIAGGSLALNRGDAIMIAGALAYAAYSAALPLKPAMNGTAFLFWLMVAALVTAVFGAGVEAAAGETIWPYDAQGWLVVLYAGLFPSLVAQALFIRGVDALGANRAGLFINLVPVFTAGLAVALLGETLGWYHVVAFVLVAGGVVLAQRAEPQRA